MITFREQVELETARSVQTILTAPAYRSHPTRAPRGNDVFLGAPRFCSDMDVSAHAH